MSVDANGRTHRPKGLPKGVAGTYAAVGPTGGDADLDESPYRLGGDGSRAEAMRLADEWFGAGDDRPPTGGSPVHTVVNRNTGGLLLVSDKGRVVDALPLGVDDDGVHIRFRDYGHVNPGRLPDVRRGMFDETWADRRPSRRHGDGRIQLVSATHVVGLVSCDCSRVISSSHASLGVLYSGCFMGVSSVSLAIASSSSWVRVSNGVFLGR